MMDRIETEQQAIARARELIAEHDITREDLMTDMPHTIAGSLSNVALMPGAEARAMSVDDLAWWTRHVDELRQERAELASGGVSSDTLDIQFEAARKKVEALLDVKALQERRNAEASSAAATASSEATARAQRDRLREMEARRIDRWAAYQIAVRTARELAGDIIDISAQERQAAHAVTGDAPAALDPFDVPRQLGSCLAREMRRLGPRLGHLEWIYGPGTADAEDWSLAEARRLAHLEI
jgi:hypothetical protein